MTHQTSKQKTLQQRVMSELSKLQNEGTYDPCVVYGLVREMLDANWHLGSAGETKADEWIPVSARLPEGSQDETLYVLVAGKNGRIGTATAWYVRGSYYSETKYQGPPCEFTHWRPLPAGPAPEEAVCTCGPSALRVTTNADCPVHESAQKTSCEDEPPGYPARKQP